MSTATTNIRDLLIYQPDLYRSEYELASYIADLVKGGCQKVEPICDKLLHNQPDGVVAACTAPVSILTGPAGTGKTTTLKMVVASLEAAGLHGAIVSPTGKAAKRADEVVNQERLENGKAPINCSTIHRFLAYDGRAGGFTFNRHRRISEYQYIVVDEFPMCSCWLLCALLAAMEPQFTRVILCGDPYQLPSIDPGNVGRDLMGVEKIPCTKLTEILRQGKDSGIVYNANQILRGKEFCRIDPRTGEEFADSFFTPTKNEADTLAKIIKWVPETIPAKRKLNAVTDIQVLCPGKKSIIGTINVNKHLRDILNTNQRGALGFKIGDKVLNKVNNYELGIVNGDVGIVEDLDISIKNTPRLVVNFGSGAGTDGTGRVLIDGERAAKMLLAYAYTVHSAQGSEVKAAIIPLHNCHYTLLNRNMLYTAMTRCRELQCIIGDKRSLEIAISNNSPTNRKTRLRPILNSMLST